MAKKSGLNKSTSTPETAGAGSDGAARPSSGPGSRGPRKQKPDPKRLSLLLSEEATRKVLALGRAYDTWSTALPAPDGTSLQERLGALYETKAFLPHLHILRTELQEAKDRELQDALAEVFDGGPEDFPPGLTTQPFPDAAPAEEVEG